MTVTDIFFLAAFGITCMVFSDWIAAFVGVILAIIAGVIVGTIGVIAFLVVTLYSVVIGPLFNKKKHTNWE